jgi:hypothetical protein
MLMPRSPKTTSDPVSRSHHNLVALLCRVATITWALVPIGRAEPEPPPAPAPAPTPAPADPAAQPQAKPNVEPLGNGKFKVGSIEFDAKSREIRVPAKVNMHGAEGESPLEYLLVRTHGKVHESLFTTDSPALEINLAFTLLSYPPSAELYALPNDTGGLSGNFPDVPEPVKRAARIRIDVESTKDGSTKRVPVGDWIRHTSKLNAMPLTPWVYGGSEFFEGTYVPESTGDIVAIFTARAAMINFTGDDRKEDTSWQVFPDRVPPIGTPVTLVFAPFFPSETSPKTSPETSPSTKTP